MHGELPYFMKLTFCLACVILPGAFLPSKAGQTLGMGLLLFTFAITYRSMLRDFLSYVLGHFGQAVILALLVAMLHGQIGPDYGIPAIFWSEYGTQRLLTATGVTLLLSVLGIVAFHLDRRQDYTRRKNNEFLTTHFWVKFGRTKRFLKGRNPALDWVVELVFEDVPAERSRSAHDLQQFLRVVRLPFLTLISLPALFPLVFPSVPRNAPVGSWDVRIDLDIGHGGWAWLIGVSWWLAGILIGVLAVRFLLWISAWIDREFVVSMSDLTSFPTSSGSLLSTMAVITACEAVALTALDAFGPPDSFIKQAPWPEFLLAIDFTALALVGVSVLMFTARLHPLLWPRFVRFLIQISLALILLILVDRRLDGAPAGMSVCILLATLSVVGAWLHLLGSRTKSTLTAAGGIIWRDDRGDPRQRARYALPLFLLFLFWVGLVNNAPYKLRFPNLDYTKPVDLRTQIDAVYPELGEFRQPPANIKLVSNDDALVAWASEARNQQKTLPKLVIVCTTGGASRASFWTAVVLDRLRRELGDRVFDQSVRLITGASGGMVGASYYVAAIHTSFASGRDFVLSNDWVDRIETNQLTRIASHIALKGPLLSLLPRLPWGDLDRAIVLENDFTNRGSNRRGSPALGVKMADLAALEAQGKIPSLVYTPVVVDDGRRLFISNLDLKSLALNKVPELGGPNPDPVSSLAGIEFFKFFRENGANDLTLATAARMSASFPFISPAVNLPCDPPLRLVDAGYYDNFGANLATSWIAENWNSLRSSVSGIVLVQIRAFVGRADRLAPPMGKESGFEIGRGYELFGGPIQAFGSGRFTGSVFRNDSEFAALSEVVNKSMKKPGFLTTVIFENSSIVEVDPDRSLEEWPEVPARCGPSDGATNTEVAMTWNLTKPEREAMKRAIPSGRGAPADRLAHIQKVVDEIKKESDPESADASPGRRRLLTKTLERLLNYERLQALKAWWTAP